MKTPFNLEAAKAGAKVVTRNGRTVRIGIWDAKGSYPLVGAVDDKLHGSYAKSWTKLGNIFIGSADDDDLFMAPPTIYVAIGLPLPNNSWETAPARSDLAELKHYYGNNPDWKLMKLVEIESDPE